MKRFQGISPGPIRPIGSALSPTIRASLPRRHAAMPRIRWAPNGPTGVQLGLQLPTVDMYRYVSPNLPEHVKLTYVVPKAMNLIKAMNCD